jgi:predicted ABC-type sugar transport system permease subunit
MTIVSASTAAVDDEQNESLVKRLTNLQSVWILGVLVIIVAYFAIAGGAKFFSGTNFSLISQNISVLAILGVGMTFIIITSGIDLSIGSVLVFASVIAAKVIEAMGGSSAGAVFVGILAGLVAGGFWGWLNGFLVAKAKVPPFIVTLGTLSAALGLAQVLTSGLNVTLDESALTDFGIYTKVFGIPALPFVALIVVILGGILLHRTKFGRYTYAIGSNAEAAKRVGVKVDRHLRLLLHRCPFRPRRGALSRPVRHHHHRGPVVDEPQRHRGRGHRWDLGVRRRGFHVRDDRRVVHPGRAPVRIRHHRRAAVLAGRRSGRRADRSRLHRPDPPRCCAPRSKTLQASRQKAES